MTTTRATYTVIPTVPSVAEFDLVGQGGSASPDLGDDLLAGVSQMKGLGSSFPCEAHTSIASVSAATLLKLTCLSR